MGAARRGRSLPSLRLTLGPARAPGWLHGAGGLPGRCGGGRAGGQGRARHCGAWRRGRAGWGGAPSERRAGSGAEREAAKPRRLDSGPGRGGGDPARALAPAPPPRRAAEPGAGEREGAELPAPARDPEGREVAASGRPPGSPRSACPGRLSDGAARPRRGAKQLPPSPGTTGSASAGDPGTGTHSVTVTHGRLAQVRSPETGAWGESHTASQTGSRAPPRHSHTLNVTQPPGRIPLGRSLGGAAEATRPQLLAAGLRAPLQPRVPGWGAAPGSEPDRIESPHLSPGSPTV